MSRSKERYALRMFLLIQSINWWTWDERFAIQSLKSSSPAWVLEAMKLPPYNKHSLPTVKQWFTVAWRMLCEVGAGDPRALPDLEEIGKPRERVYQDNEGGHASTRAKRRQGEEQLKEQLFKAFKSRFYARSQPAV